MKVVEHVVEFMLEPTRFRAPAHPDAAVMTPGTLIETFEKLKEHGVAFDVRKVPSDSKENMDTLLQKAREGLGI